MLTNVVLSLISVNNTKIGIWLTSLVYILAGKNSTTYVKLNLYSVCNEITITLNIASYFVLIFPVFFLSSKCCNIFLVFSVTLVSSVFYVYPGFSFMLELVVVCFSHVFLPRASVKDERERERERHTHTLLPKKVSKETTFNMTCGSCVGP